MIEKFIGYTISVIVLGLSLGKPDMRTQVGTKIFWPPEFFDRDYGQKVLP